MQKKKAQSQIDFALAMLIFFVFFGIIILTGSSPIYGFGVIEDDLKTDSDMTATNIANSELKNKNGVITDEKLSNIVQRDKLNQEMIASSKTLEANVTFKNADNPEGYRGNKGNLPILLQRNNTVGPKVPTVGTTSSTQIITVDGKLIKMNVTVWRPQ